MIKVRKKLNLMCGEFGGVDDDIKYVSYLKYEIDGLEFIISPADVDVISEIKFRRNIVINH